MLNPNRRLKSLWEKDFFANNSSIDPESRGRQLAPELRDKPMYVRCLLLIPKNLVYVFILVICFAFAAMTYITYTEQNLREFVTWGKSQRKEVDIHSLYKAF